MKSGNWARWSFYQIIFSLCFYSFFSLSSFLHIILVQYFMKLNLELRIYDVLLIVDCFNSRALCFWKIQVWLPQQLWQHCLPVIFNNKGHSTFIHVSGTLPTYQSSNCQFPSHHTLTHMGALGEGVDDIVSVCS